MNRVYLQIGPAPPRVQPTVLRRLDHRQVQLVHIRVTARVVAAILEVLIDAVAIRLTASGQRQLRRLRSKKALPGESTRGCTPATLCFNNHTVKGVALRPCPHHRLISRRRTQGQPPAE